MPAKPAAAVCNNPKLLTNLLTTLRTFDSKVIPPPRRFLSANVVEIDWNEFLRSSVRPSKLFS